MSTWVVLTFPYQTVLLKYILNCIDSCIHSITLISDFHLPIFEIYGERKRDIGGHCLGDPRVLDTILGLSELVV